MPKTEGCSRGRSPGRTGNSDSDGCAYEIRIFWSNFAWDPNLRQRPSRVSIIKRVHGSAQWCGWLCSRLCSLIKLIFASTKTFLLSNSDSWATSHDTSLFPGLVNRLMTFSAVNSSRNWLMINQTPALQTDFIYSNFNNERLSTFSERMLLSKSYLQPARWRLLYGTELTELDQIQTNCSQPAAEWNGKFWNE